MHKNKQSQNSDENQITSFNKTTVDPVALVKLDELDEATLAEVVGGRDGTQEDVCGIKG